MTKRTKKRDNENNPFAVLPLELIVEILLKLPAKSILRLIFVSKHWSSIIRGKEFTNLYIARSSSRPCLLILYRNMESHFLESYSQEDPSSDHQRVIITSSHQDNYWPVDGFSAPVRGLICLQNGTKVRIGNPSTGQFITLPRVKTYRRGLHSFFGYDPVNDVYKVLCMTVQRIHTRRGSLAVSVEHQVFTIGPKQKWRKIECKHPHLPSRNINYINGVVYYYAWTKDGGFLMSFDLTSEDFNVVKLPEHDLTCEHFNVVNLVNYCGKIAWWNQSEAKLNVWVLQDAKKQEWSEVSHLVPSWTDLVGSRDFRFTGTLSTGELIFAPIISINPPHFLISYDLKGNIVKTIVIEAIQNNSSDIVSYFDHVENPIVL